MRGPLMFRPPLHPQRIQKSTLHKRPSRPPRPTFVRPPSGMKPDPGNRVIRGTLG
jgi:hypothetical protein